MKRYRVKMSFKSPVHIGYKEKLYNTTDYIVHSDTLFGGIMNCYSLLYGIAESDSLAGEFLAGASPFKISSAFCYINNEYLVPKPACIDLTVKLNDFKKAKKVKFVSQEYLLGKSSELHIKGAFALCSEYEGSVFEIAEMPRVVLDRVTNASEIYYVSSCRFEKGCGLWFYIDVEDCFESRLLSSIRLLGDEGIGGERTYGFGHFSVDFIEESYSEDSSERYMAFSLMIPNKQDLLGNKLESYELTERGGYIYSPYDDSVTKKKCRMICEGSIFNGRVSGSVLDITPEGFNCHKVIKYGLSYLLPVYAG